jgi:hypothetical protein
MGWIWWRYWGTGRGWMTTRNSHPRDPLYHRTIITRAQTLIWWYRSNDEG